MSDRHPKWVRVEPGTVIPAGQPYRIEFPDSFIGRFGHISDTCRESVSDKPCEIHNPENTYFIDSSWRPPLELPTEPTWGIAVLRGKHPFRVSRWSLRNGWFFKLNGAAVCASAVSDFIPLTDEQVARIEQAR